MLTTRTGTESKSKALPIAPTNSKASFSGHNPPRIVSYTRIVAMDAGSVTRTGCTDMLKRLKPYFLWLGT
jgi:hypothetical protein